MFDAKSILEQIAGAGSRQTSGPAAGAPGGAFGDLLNEIAGQLSKPGGAGGGSPLPGGIDDIIRNVTGGSSGAAGSGSGGGGLDDILAKVKDQLGGNSPGSAGAIFDTLGQVLTQATAGAKEGATKIGDATGAGKAIQDALGGRSPDEIIAQIKDLAAKNQLATGAVLGGLGGLILGTRTGRGLATGAAKIGALALIGGLAYKAYQNYQAGKPILDGGASAAANAAPVGSGFEADAVSNDTATLIIRTMIAAAAADGRIDDQEKSRIAGMLGADASAEARAFVAKELERPASPAAIAAAVKSPAEAAQIYTAARLAISPDSVAETAFLATLATALNIDPELAKHIDATAREAA